ncbi:Structure-specific endonuclease subunit SLX1 [Mycena kentingensis (nom. inval.)]|nr:Structure-specific endonuclease subunit SLX1 [Mycena kentingensis (nom. inval.)]
MPPTPSTGCPPFYACYLLKSIQTPTSTATYIGSTPHPPRRIRQHNGELTQGAWKTRSKRPWIMSMIVYGFPSKLTALQFEWAWQHVHKTRHLRDANGKALLSRSSGLNSNIRAVRLMLATHPYSTWPLHVKLFTDAAVKGWTLAQKSAPALPPGFTYQIELEGVDGKSGKAGSGRDGPLAVDDAQFTSVLLAKNTALLASSGAISCIICKEHIPNYTADALSTGLCPAPSCSAVAHLTCLSTRFITEQAHSSSDILPRGGDCPVCGTYALWGDVVRGSFRRAAGGIPLELEDDDALFMPDSESDGEAVPTGKPSAKKAARKRPGDNSSEGEEFDFAVAERPSSESEADAPRKRRRPRQEKLPASPRKKAKSQGPSPETRSSAYIQDKLSRRGV